MPHADDVGPEDLGRHSYWWIQDAIEAAKRRRLVFWYVPATAGVPIVHRQLIDRYFTVETLYYFFHNFYGACRAARASGPHAAANTRRLLELLCATPEIDGSFIDSGYRLGKPYSTALGLLCLDLLLDRKSDDGR